MVMDEKAKVSKKLQLTANAILVYSPEKELEVLSKLAEKGDQVDWKPAIILASAYLEKYGIDRLIIHFKSRKIAFAKKLVKLSLPDVAVLLYGLELIPEKYFTWIDNIWHERLVIIHQKREMPVYVGNEANEKYRAIIARALEVLKFLKVDKVR
jgi:hypothetical protein